MTRRAGKKTLFAVGFAIATVGAMCGIGGGLFAVPFLHYVRKLELKRAIATSLVLVLATSVFATLAELARPDPKLHASIVIATVSGVILGTEAGFYAAKRISTRALRATFVVVLSFAAWRLYWAESGALQPADPALWLTKAACWKAGLAGFGGGIVAPLLGLGGGLLMVPALFLGLPGIGFAEARATSLAAGTIAAVRSLWLHGRAGRVELPAVGPLAIGAMGGAVLGVNLVHLEGLVQVARVLLALILVFSALRFLRDLYGRREAD
jgi:hypothetical protein